MKELFELIEDSIRHFRMRRLVTLAFFVFLSLVLFWLYDLYTGHFHLNQIKVQLQLIEHAAELKTSINKDEHGELENVLNDVIGRITGERDPWRWDALREAPGWTVFLQYAALAAPWLILATFAIPGVRRGQGKDKQAMFGIIAFGLLFGLLGLVVPTDWPSSARYLWLPWGAMVAVIAVIVIVAPKKTQQKKGEDKQTPHDSQEQ